MWIKTLLKYGDIERGSRMIKVSRQCALNHVLSGKRIILIFSPDPRSHGVSLGATEVDVENHDCNANTEIILC